MNVLYKTKIWKNSNFSLPNKITEYKKFNDDLDNFYKKKVNFKSKLKNYLSTLVKLK